MSDALPPILSVRNLQARPSGVTRLNIKQLAVSPQGMTVILGPNGAGKSLFLRLIHGLKTPDAGDISWRDGTRQAMVFQRPVLLRRSVAGNIDFVLKRQKLGRAVRAEKLDYWLRRARLSGQAQQPARSLSGGEQQRLNLVRAMATMPDVLLLDEPTANLDPGATRDIETLISAAADDGTKVIMVTHNVGQAKRLAQEVIFLHNGQVVEHGTMRDVMENPKSETMQRFLAGHLVL